MLVWKKRQPNLNKPERMTIAEDPRLRGMYDYTTPTHPHPPTHTQRLHDTHAK